MDEKQKAIENVKNIATAAGSEAAKAIIEKHGADYLKSEDGQKAFKSLAADTFEKSTFKMGDDDVTVGEFIKRNQKQFDELVIRTQNSTAEGKAKNFNTVLKKSIEENSDSLLKFANDKTIKSTGFDLNLKDVADISTANVTGGTVWGSIYQPGIIELPKRKVHLRDLLRKGNIGPGTDYYFMRQNGLGEGNPAPVAEGSTKPQFDEDLQEASVKIETIAGWERITRKAMLNVPGLVSFLQSRMTERLMRVEDELGLYGNGTSPNLKGILTSGNFVASNSTATKLSERLIDDIARFEDTYERDANGIVLRPVDYMSFFKQKADGSGEYDLPRNFVYQNGVLYVSGVPVYMTTALHTGAAGANDYVLGDWQNGAAWLTQEQMRIEFFEQDRDNVIKNLVTVRIEETVAMPVYGGDYFIKGTVPATT